MLQVKNFKKAFFYHSLILNGIASINPRDTPTRLMVNVTNYENRLLFFVQNHETQNLILKHTILYINIKFIVIEGKETTQ